MSDPFTYQVLGAAMAVHRELGPGLDESFYHDLLSDRLQESGIGHMSRVRGELYHRGILVDRFEADLICEKRLVLELKHLKGAFDPEHYVQIFSYLKFWRVDTGLLFDFGKESLVHRRINFVESPCPTVNLKEVLADCPGRTSELLCSILRGISDVLSEHGLGYRDTTYRALLAADFTAQGIDCRVLPRCPVVPDEKVIGEAECNCISVNNTVGMLVLALRKSISAADVAILQNYLRLLDLQAGVIVNFGKTSLAHRWVRPGSKESSYRKD